MGFKQSCLLFIQNDYFQHQMHLTAKTLELQQQKRKLVFFFASQLFSVSLLYRKTLSVRAIHASYDASQYKPNSLLRVCFHRVFAVFFCFNSTG